MQAATRSERERERERETVHNTGQGEDERGLNWPVVKLNIPLWRELGEIRHEVLHKAWGLSSGHVCRLLCVVAGVWTLNMYMHVESADG